jgi:hypothetical protein
MKPNKVLPASDKTDPGHRQTNPLNYSINEGDEDVSGSMEDGLHIDEGQKNLVMSITKSHLKGNE